MTMTTLPPARTRNICIVAHVDHGKSSFADSLLASNGIISSRMAGTIRYLDAREDEQERGITMESSAVSLRWRIPRKVPDAEPVLEEYRINLIDTPGHVDFSSEVSSASRLCDGALVLVDAVEGVCTQTIMVLKQMFVSNIKPLLVINKMDRVITELKLSPSEAYYHLSRVIEDVNAVVGSFFASERMEEDWRMHERDQGTTQELDDSSLYFDPAQGTVLFASAMDGWAFRISRFAQLYATKLGMREDALNKCLWGDFFFDPKEKRVISRKKMEQSGRKLKPLFVQFVLDNIWAVYEGISDPAKVERIVQSLSIKARPQELRAKDTRNLLLSIFAQWLPLAPSAFRAVVEKVPAPPQAQGTRMPRVLHPEISFLDTRDVAPTSRLERDLYEGEAGAERQVIAYVSKLFVVRRDELPENQRRALTADEMRERARQARERRAAQEESRPLEARPLTEGEPAAEDLTEAAEAEDVMLGFARLLSGRLKLGQQMQAVLPKYNAALPSTHPSNAKHVVTFTVEQLYTMMGKELVAVDTVEAGNLVAVGGLEGKVMRNATLCSDELVNLAGVTMNSAPIVRVALEPQNPSEMAKLDEGLRMLNQADPCVETLIQETGEHVILTAGELHLERCLKDLRDRFAKIAISVSKPIVPFRETAVSAQDMAPPKTPGSARGTVIASVQSGMVQYAIRAAPLPNAVTSFLLANARAIQALHGRSIEEEVDLASAALADASSHSVKPEAFWDSLKDVLSSCGRDWTGIAESVWAFGPKRIGPNMLIDSTGDAPRALKRKLERAVARAASDEGEPTDAPTARELDENFETAFQLATNRGPLCAEPVLGMAYFLESVSIDLGDAESDTVRTRFSNARGSLISSAQESFRNGLLDWSPRLLLAMYSCDIQATSEVLGRVYAVVARRRGRIVAEEMREGTAFFTIKALLPVVESFGFADEIRKRTSGIASPQLVFHGFEMLDQDPFWVPTTEEELEDLGEKSDRENVAKRYMDGVRKRKGMHVERKVVEFAERQKTMKNA